MGGAVAGPGSLLSRGTLLNPILNPFAIFGGKVGQAASDPLNLTGAFTPPAPVIAPPPALDLSTLMPPRAQQPTAISTPRVAAAGLSTIVTSPEGLTSSPNTTNKQLLGG